MKQSEAKTAAERMRVYRRRQTARRAAIREVVAAKTSKETATA